MRLISDILNTLSYLAAFFLIGPAVIKGDYATIKLSLVFMTICFSVYCCVLAVEWVNSAYHKRNEK